ncbi:RNA methyltransferase [Pseudoclavibacter endophyticus]|uniref:RNA methyltransferase n=1 Tax=Pseudoclavibacter endophyticus TaxID=1778590 RepID=A0A6H9WM09_9MICO|nr:RNA methyltransferase [Pseudoclavibacter endophyticus]KAB1646942.1 RNA methyltransferase [Pseudoclavibacter endophyticus]GGA74217.1 RNA methyltransferase [Pseudoclavibacter endophyticus]
MIESPRNARVREVRRLQQKAERTSSGLFLLEGPQAVREALECRPELVTDLFVTPTALERHTDLGDLAFRHELELQFATEEAIDAMADTRTPQGVIAVCRQFPASIRTLFGQSSQAEGGDDRDGEPGPKLVAILEEVRDPGNAGTIIRAADAAGADAVILTGRTVDLYNPKVVRATTGSLFHLPIAVDIELDAVLARVREAGMQVIAADVKGDAITELSQDELARPTAWVFGNEARGLSDDNVALADRSVRVPIYGLAESMNLSTAASVVLYASAFAQRAGE